MARAIGGFRSFFLNAAGTVADSWLVGAGVFPPGAWGMGRSSVVASNAMAVLRARPVRADRGGLGKPLRSVPVRTRTTKRVIRSRGGIRGETIRRGGTRHANPDDLPLIREDEL